jgi:aspartokinase
LINIGDVVVRSNLAESTYSNSSRLFQKQAELLNKTSTKKESFCTFSQGVNESTIIISNDLQDELTSLMGGENCVSSNKGLSSITLKLPKENTQISGIYYYILKKLAWENINIVEIISTTHEFTLIVRDEDIDRAFSIMMRIKKP